MSSAAISRTRCFILRLALLPAGAAQPIELHVAFVGAVAGQQLDVLDGQEQLAAVVDQLQAIVRRAGDVDRLQAIVAADAVIDMGDEIAGREARGFGEEVSAPARERRRARHHAVAEDVLLGDDGEIRRLEAMLQPHDADADGVAVQRLRLGEVRDRAHGGQAVIGRARRPSRSAEPSLHAASSTRFFSACSVFDMRGRRLEDVDAALRALRREVAALLAAGIDGAFWIPAPGTATGRAPRATPSRPSIPRPLR